MGWTLTMRDVPTPYSSNSLKVTSTTYGGSARPAPWGENENATGSTAAALAISPQCSGSGTATTDGAGSITVHCTDGLGRLSDVKETNGNTTQYGYVRGNLTSVNVAGQYRSFEYDSLDRLTKACNPETGTAICTTSPLPSTGLENYTYDPNGNLLTRTDARGITTTLTGYDALNRPQGKAYTKNGVAEGTPAVTYVYDQGRKGVLASVSTGVGSSLLSTTYAYDALGRIQGSTQITAGRTYGFTYQYSLTDRLSSMQYPSGRMISYVPDAFGRISQVQNAATLANYATVDYTPGNGIQKVTMGNGIVEQTTWNDRLQMTGLTAGKAGATADLSLGFFRCAGQLVSCATGNNGNLRSQTITGGGLNLTQTYTYDSVNRLTGASESGIGPWNEAYAYTDSANRNIGNRWVDISVRSGLPDLTLETPQASSWYLGNNQINTWPMDGSGNVLGVSSMTRSFAYDAENRQVTATINGVTTTYTYDGQGQRVQKSVGGVVTTYVYDASGELAAEYSAQSSASACGTITCYLTVDHLGSTRLLTDAAGNVARRYDYLPFGVELFAGTNGRTTANKYTNSPDGFNPKFTGQIRDLETGLDYFHARYYSSAQGRFTSSDPGNAGADLADPQTWHGYAYVNNSPLNFTDPSGEGIFGTVFGILAGIFTANPWIGLAASGVGNGIDAAIWGPQAAGIPGTPFNLGSLTSCGGPLGTCGSLGAGPWSENTGLAHVQDPGRFIFSFEGQRKICGDFYCDANGHILGPLPAHMMDASDPGANVLLAGGASIGLKAAAGVGSAVAAAATRVGARAGLSVGTMGVAIGKLGSQWHVAYEGEGFWMHWAGRLTNNAVSLKGAEAWVARSGARVFQLPVLFTDRVAATCGMPATSCANAAWNAFWKGWGF